MPATMLTLIALAVVAGDDSNALTLTLKGKASDLPKDYKGVAAKGKGRRGCSHNSG